MADHYLSKTRVAPEDFVDAGGRSVLDRYAELRDLLAARAGPEVSALFAEPLISRGNDQSPPTVSWYTDVEGDARPLSALPAAERSRAETYLSEHLRPVQSLADDPETADLALGALTVLGGDDVLVVDGKPVIVNWGLMTDGNGENATARAGHYAATLGRFLPLAGATQAARVPETGHPDSAADFTDSTNAAAGPVAAGSVANAEGTARNLPLIAWLPLLVLLLLAALTLAWILMPGNRLFHNADARVVTDDATLAAARAHNESLRERQSQLETAIEGAVCRADGVLVLPEGITPEGLTPPKEGTAFPERAEALPNAVLPSNPERVVLNDPEAAEGDNSEVTLLSLIEARTVLILSAGSGASRTGSGLVIGPGLVVTNHHVIEPALVEGGRVLVAGKGLSEPLEAEVIKTLGPLEQTGGDFALLRIADESLPAFTVLQSETSLKLTNVVAAGYPADVMQLDAGYAALKAGEKGAMPDMTVTDGTINTEQQIGPQTHLLMHSAPLSKGNSGGPLVDMCGRLLGVNSFVARGQMQNRGYALSGADLLAFLAGTPASPRLVEGACAPLIVTPKVSSAVAQPEKKN